MSYRAAFLGAVAGFAFLCVFATLLGLAWWAAVLFFGIYFMVVTAMAKARAEVGPPAVDLFLTAPGKVMVALCGGKLLGPGTLVSMSLLYWLWLEYPWHPMPHQLESLRIADQQRMSHRRMTRLMLGAAMLGWTAAFLIVLHLDYSVGAANARQGGTQMYYARQAYNLSQGWFTEMAPPDRSATLAMIVGGMVTAALSVARLQIVNWPLHPVGYALGSSFTTNYLWLPLWLSCLAKGLIVKYGGLTSYRRFMPLFLGLILGEFVIGSLWAILGVITRLPVYVFWPY